MSNSIKKKANTFIKQQKLTSVDYSALKNVAIKMGYTIIEFNNITNDRDVETVICNLDLGEAILKSRGFTYVSKDYRLIFINEDLNDEEKLLILSHEFGHIVCDHFSIAPIIGRDVKEEHEANEFAHYLLEQRIFCRIKRIIQMYHNLIIALVAVLCLILGALSAYLIMHSSDSYHDNLYITSTGTCYHKKECIFVKNKTNIKRITKEQFEKGTYVPCDVCLPDEE